MAYEETFMRRALALSRQALDKAGTEPFGAVVVLDGAIVGEGLNHSLAHFDPTSHSEVEAIRNACHRLQCIDLSGAEMYTSCEPCAMCVAVMEVAGIGRLYYASSMAQAGDALAGLTREQRHPVDVDRLRREAGATVDKRAVPAEQHLDTEAAAILRTWAGTRKTA
ncbi:nucleoside deaminase [Labrys okinawensis]|uniref:nucleoside deaminase n=1 Tax=Labrys okinawensis TaxID=346911 RepID=UPI0039BD7434